jgi:1,4-alpha-glucan branching enzyme
MAKGYLMLVLHAHLPFVRHPEYSKFLEENWLQEAISETYLPLLRVFRRLHADGVPFRLTMSISPTLSTMLTDPLLQDRYIAHLGSLLELAGKEVERTASDPEMNALARMYQQRFQDNLKDYTETYGKNILKGFKSFQENGNIELITTTATHCFLPLLQVSPQGVDAQLQTAMDSHLDFIGRRSKGIWLPECGYYPGLEERLARHDVEFFFVDTHSLLYADKKPKYGVFAPVFTPNDIAAFGRDPETSRAVWSSDTGYPADPAYREYYRDIGFDLPLEYIRPYIHGNDIRINTGIKYWSITGKTNHKLPYNRAYALAKAAEHADHFIYMRLKQLERIAPLMDRTPVIVSPYDAELFGHWWFEGPDWLETMIRKVADTGGAIRMITPTDYLTEYPANQVATPSFSSWGNNGYAEVWLEHSNDWIYPHIYNSLELMTKLAKQFPQESGFRRRALNQAVRELLLAQASDWAFIMKTGTMVPYAVKRTREHIHNFNKLYKSVLRNELDINWLIAVESKNNIFPKIDYRIFCEKTV